MSRNGFISFSHVFQWMLVLNIPTPDANMDRIRNVAGVFFSCCLFMPLLLAEMTVAPPWFSKRFFKRK